MSYTLITAKTEWTLDLSEVKAHLDIDSSNTDQDAYIQELIYAVQDEVEDRCDLSINAETWELRLDTFPLEIEIYHFPISAITSVKYIDGDGAEQTVSSDNYKTDLISKPARIVPYDSYAWPTTKDTWPHAVKVRYVTGFTSPSVCPADIRQAMYLIIGDWFTNRQDKGRRFDRVSERLLNKYRYR